MHKTYKILAITATLLTGGFTLPAVAGGIPTFDALSIAQMVLDSQTLSQENAAQLEQAIRAVTQAKDLYDDNKRLITGNSKYGSKHNSSDLTDYLPTQSELNSWKKIYDAINSSEMQQMREEYGLVSEDPVQQLAYDKQLVHLRTDEAAMRAHNKRISNIVDLQYEADLAETPQEKQDIANRLAAEQAAIANESNRLATSKDIMERQEKLYAQKQNQTFDKFMSTGKE